MIHRPVPRALLPVFLLAAASLLVVALPPAEATTPDAATPVSLITSTPAPGSILVSTAVHSHDLPQDPEWVSGGPTGATISGLAAHPTDPDTVYASSRQGIYKSADRGDTWTVALADREFLSLAIDPVSTDTIYAGDWQGVVKSTDGGQTWENPGAGLPDWARVQALAIAPGEPHTVYAGTVGFGVYKSENGGANWTAANTGLPSETQVYALSIDPHVPGQLYAATDAGVFKSTTAGTSWMAMNTGLPIRDYRAVAADPDNPNTVYAACYYNPYYAGVYKSADGGANWSLARSGILGADARVLVAVPGAVYIATDGGVFRSVDGGERWQGLWPDRPASLQITSLAVAPGVPPRIYLGARSDNPEEQGVWQSTLTAPPPVVLLPASPAKAVLIVGPIDAPTNDQTRAAIEGMEQRATQLEEKGLYVVRLYHPYATWQNIRANLSGASIVLYHGHGFGYNPDDPNYLDTGGGNNGFCITDPDNLNGATLVTQDMLIAYSQLAEDAIVMLFACYSAGSSASDPQVVTQEVARRRVNDYAYTFHTIGGRAYYGGGDWRHYLGYMLSSLDRTAGSAYQTAPGYDADPLRAFQHSQYPTYDLWLSPSVNATGQVTAWWTAFSGDSSLTGRQALGHNYPRMSVQPSSVAFFLEPTAPDMASLAIQIVNTGGGSLNWDASVSDDTWLGNSPSSGSAPEDVLLSVDKSGLAQGTYIATVTVTGRWPVYGSPQLVPVALYIGDVRRAYLPLVLQEE